MSEYNLPNEIPNENLNEIPSTQQKNPDYLKALLVGLGVSVVIAIILAIIAIVTEEKSYIFLVIGASWVGVTIRVLVPDKSFIGAVLCAVLCAATYLIYQFIVGLFGYYYVDNADLFWWILGGSVLVGPFIYYCCNDD